MSFFLRVAVLITGFFSAFACAAFKQQSLPARSYAAPQDAATGAIVLEDEDRLELNLSPCAAQPAIVIFRKPFIKEAAGMVSCSGTNVSQAQVIQK